MAIRTEPSGLTSLDEPPVPDAPVRDSDAPAVEAGAGSRDGSWWQRRSLERTARKDTRRQSRTDKRVARSERKTWFGRHPKGTVTLALLLALSPVWWSMGNALAVNGSGGAVPTLAEWVRDHGGAGVVRWIENIWYSHHEPPKGGLPAKGAIPLPFSAGSSSGGLGGRSPGSSPEKTVTQLPVPPPIEPYADPPVPGEGVWHPAGRLVDGVPAVYEAYMRPDAVHTSVVVGVAFMDTDLLCAQQYSGSYVPGGGPWKYTAPVSPSAAQTLVAAFNSGFRIQDAEGGYYAEGKTFAPLREGAASLVVFADGTSAVGEWGRDFAMTANVVAVRQNLHLLVDEGKPVPGLQANDNSKWGYTLGNAVYVWRSGVGETADGGLVYVGGPGMNITTLADVLARAGAVRAMELDINTAWVNFTAYAPSGASDTASPSNGTTLLSAMDGGASRYFGSWDRDFVAMSACAPGERGGPNPVGGRRTNFLHD